MAGLTRIQAVAAPLPLANIDTDQLVPARFLGRPREAIGDVLLRDLRFDADGAPNPGFVLNRPEYRDARILVALRNFGCGSSREAAVWALQERGFQAVIAPTFGDIFYGNSFKNFFLPVTLPASRVEALLAALEQAPGAELRIELAPQRVTGPDGFSEGFEIDPFLKESLLTGRDELAMTLTYLDRIEAFEQRRTPL